MNNKVLIFIIIITLVLVSVFVLLRFNLLKKPFQLTPTTTQAVKTSNEMSGRIIEVKNGSIVVQGVVKPLDLRISENKTIEFIITSQTVLKNSVVSITAEQMKKGGTHKPETQIKPGNISDLVVDIGIFSIKSQENLLQTDKATAIDINYYTFDIPSLQR